MSFIVKYIHLYYNYNFSRYDHPCEMLYLWQSEFDLKNNLDIGCREQVEQVPLPS